MSLNRVVRPAALLAVAGTGLAASIPRAPAGLVVELPEISTKVEKISATIDPDLLGLAFEESSWVRYATDDKGGINEFSANLMDSIYSRTGGKPIIRLGGTSPDYAHYLPDQEEPALPVAEQDNYQDVGGTTIGKDYWPIAKLFENAVYMVQVPLANTNVSEAVAWAKAAVHGIGLDQIHSIQPGNEPNLYDDNYHGEDNMYLGPPDFQGTLTNESYVGNYTKYAKAIYDAIDDLPKNFFTAFDIAAEVQNPEVAEYILTPETCFGLGLNDDDIIKEVSHHYYQNQAGNASDLEKGLMTMSLTHQNLDYFKPRIDWLAENEPDIPFIINEIGNSLCPTNVYEYQARLGSALWAVDFYLYGLSIGVSRFNYQQIMHSGFDLWLPHKSAGHDAQVFSNFYSQPFLADFVGTSGKTKMSKIDVGGGDDYPNLSAYAALEGEQVKRVAVANLDYWNATSSDGPRPSAQMSIKVDKGVDEVLITHLSSPDGAGADASTITYAGSQWTYESLGKEIRGVRNDTENVKVEDGYVTIKVPSSEAVMVYLDW